MSNLYSISDLFVTATTFGFHAGSRSCWLDWVLVHHPLYREDRLTVMYGQRVLAEGLYLAVKPELDLRRVKGETGEHAGSLSASASCDMLAPLSVGVSYRREWVRLGGCPELTLEIALRAANLTVVCNGVQRGTAARDVRIGMEVEVSSSFFLFTGYRAVTDEIFGGVLFSSGALLVGCAWNDHPSLGRTWSCGVGRVWYR